MWVMALLGMMTSFAENVLGVYYRRKNEKGEWSGGAMYYLTDGLGAKPGCKTVGKVLAILFACFCILASFGIGNMSQINSIAGNMNAAFHVPYLATGLALMVVTALIVIGGLKRVAAVTGQNADGLAGPAQLCDHLANIDALATGISTHTGDSVYSVQREVRDLNGLVQRRIQSNGVDHGNNSLLHDC